jgi:hypothetical protein
MATAATDPDQRLGSRMGDQPKGPAARPNTPECRPLSASEIERLTRFVGILLEWDERRRTIEAVPRVTEHS